MTKKHFEAAARQVRDMLDAGRPGYECAIIAESFADLFQSFNPRFDRERFIAACGGRWEPDADRGV